jgi:cell division protease FtsH
MTRTRKLLQSLRTHPRLAGAFALALALLAGTVTLQQRAADEAQARRLPEVRAFEADALAWLDNERSLADFGRSLAARELSVAGLAASPPGLVLYTLKNGEKASTTVPGCTPVGCAGTLLDGLGERSAEAGFALVSVHVDPRTASHRLLDGAETVLSPLLVIGIVLGALFVATRLQMGLGGASMLTVQPPTRFADVVGSDEAKAALARVRAFLGEPAKYARLGAAPPRGVLLVGPPGTGKTLLARALAGECKASFIAVDGSYFTAMYYGAGVAKVKELFKLARRHAPCVLFIDEIDGIGQRSQGRAGGGGGAESELNRIINRVLVEMDGFDPLNNVVVVGATNHEDNIDEAMRRPGRFDMLVRLALPMLPDRQRLFDLYLGRLQHDGRADTLALARMSAGMSPADIANTVNKAASTAAEQGAERVGAEHLLRAIETQQLGGDVSPVKALLSEATRRRLAYHEAGHALVAHLLAVGSVERVSIEPRGQALGVTHIHRASEEPLYQKAELSARLAMLLGGREAELMVLNSVSSGASDDLKRASELAVNMVGSLGFSDRFGLLSVAGVPKELLGPDVQAAVLDEARALLDEAQARCRRLLGERRVQLDGLAASLLDHEVLSGEPLARWLAGAAAQPKVLEAA